MVTFGEPAGTMGRGRLGARPGMWLGVDSCGNNGCCDMGGGAKRGETGEADEEGVPYVVDRVDENAGRWEGPASAGWEGEEEGRDMLLVVVLGPEVKVKSLTGW